MTSSFATRRIRPDRLFCYGTLCDAAVMCRVCGILPDHEPAMLTGYIRSALTGRAYPGLIRGRGQPVDGILYAGLARRHWRRLDQYEGSEYRRIRVQVETAGRGRKLAWVYVLQPRQYRQRAQRNWSLARFRREQLHLYQAQLRHY